MIGLGQLFIVGGDHMFDAVRAEVVDLMGGFSRPWLMFLLPLN